MHRNLVNKSGIRTIVCANRNYKVGNFHLLFCQRKKSNKFIRVMRLQHERQKNRVHVSTQIQSWKLGRIFLWETNFARKRKRQHDVIYAAMLFSLKLTDTWRKLQIIIELELHTQPSFTLTSIAETQQQLFPSKRHIDRQSVEPQCISAIEKDFNYFSMGLFTLPVTAGCWRKSLAFHEFSFRVSFAK